MKKRWKRLAAAGLAAVMAAGLTAGCGKKATPENLFKDMEKNAEQIESAKCNLNIKIEMSDGTDSIGFTMDMDLGATTDPQAFHGKGSIVANAMGMEQQAEMEMYQVEEDGEYATYTLMEDEWSKTVTSDETEEFNIDMFQDIEDQAELFELEDDTVEVNGKDCFELKGNIGGALISGMFGEDMISSLSGLDLDEDALSDVEIPCTYAVYRDEILPARLYVDMADIMDTFAGAAAEEITVSECSIEITYLEYNSVDEIRVPEEAITATEDDSWDDGYDWDEEEEDLPAGADPVEPSGELGDDWETFTVQVNDKVLTLPCTIEELEAAGLTMDTEYTPETYVVNPDEYELAWFEDAAGNTIMVDMVNLDADAKEIKDCQIGGISVYDYDIEYGGLTVIFPGGVQIGTPIGDVLGAYGDADDLYEGDYSNSYYWYGGENFYDACTIDTDPETDTVMSMSISHY